jgi:very-short-patch-repair endonuclease
VRMGSKMLGQTNKTIKSRRLPQDLRRGMTDAERKLWGALRNHPFSEFKVRRQHPFRGYVLDFVSLSAKLVIEIDGGQHADDVVHDAKRTLLLRRAGFRVLRFWNNEALLETEAVLTRIWDELQQRTPSSPPPSP